MFSPNMTKKKKKRFLRMVDLTPLDRLTRKRNSQLQKQLDVQLQIMQEEYRMTKKDHEKNTKEISEFLMYLRHTAPGLSSYGQPDTRAMNAKSIMMERRYQNSDESSDNVLVPDEILYQQKTKKGTGGKKDEGGGKDGKENERGEDEDDTRAKPSSASSYRNEYFNRRIVLDSKRRSFLQHTMDKRRTKSTDPEIPNPASLRQLGGAESHTSFHSNRETKSKIDTRRPKTSTPRSHRPETPKYGSEAYSKQEENIRKYVLDRFDVIFDPRDERPERRVVRNTPAATPIVVPKSGDVEDVVAPLPSDEQKPLTSSTPVTSHPTYIMNRRVAWSAPPKRREDPITAVANINNAQYGGKRQNLSVTPRSGTAQMVRAQQRPHSIMSMASQDERGAELMLRTMNQQRQKNSKRPKTAPPNYELRRRSMAAPRQQVAGILAEIQSRRADTRAMLTKSKQLKQMVKKLVPDEPKDDSFSD